MYLLLVDCDLKLPKIKNEFKKGERNNGYVIYALNFLCYLYKCTHLLRLEFGGGRG